jgi:hypothetical protein
MKSVGSAFSNKLQFLILEISALDPVISILLDPDPVCC